MEAYVHDAAQDMRIARDQLSETLDALSERDWARFVPYGSRTVHEGHLLHIIDTGAVAAWPDIDAGNAQRLEERRFSDGRTLTEEYLSMRHETLRLIAQLKREHLDLEIEMTWKATPAKPHTILDYVLGFDAHDRAHRDQLRAAMKYATSTR